MDEYLATARIVLCPAATAPGRARLNAVCDSVTKLHTAHVPRRRTGRTRGHSARHGQTVADTPHLTRLPYTNGNNREYARQTEKIARY